jgi:hypothetical protein
MQKTVYKVFSLMLAVVMFSNILVSADISETNVWEENQEFIGFDIIDMESDKTNDIGKKYNTDETSRTERNEEIISDGLVLGRGNYTVEFTKEAWNNTSSSDWGGVSSANRDTMDSAVRDDVNLAALAQREIRVTSNGARINQFVILLYDSAGEMYNFFRTVEGGDGLGWVARVSEAEYNLMGGWAIFEKEQVDRYGYTTGEPLAAWGKWTLNESMGHGIIEHDSTTTNINSKQSR